MSISVGPSPGRCHPPDAGGKCGPVPSPARRIPPALCVALSWTYTVSPIRWGIQAVVMSSLNVVFDLTHPYVHEAEALNLFYVAGIGTQSSVFCLMILCLWWCCCTAIVGLVFWMRFRTRILQRAQIQVRLGPGGGVSSQRAFF